MSAAAPVPAGAAGRTYRPGRTAILIGATIMAAVLAAAERAQDEFGPGGALLIWDGDWLRSRGQDGKGLASVRQAVAVEVAFAPAACRAPPVRGLVVISLTDRPGGPRVALGRDRWRWSDLTR